MKTRLIYQSKMNFSPAPNLANHFSKNSPRVISIRGVVTDVGAMKRRRNQNQNNMNTKSLVIVGAVVAAFALNSLATEPLLTPRQKDIQIHVVPNQVTTAGINVVYLNDSSALLTPRAKDTQIKVVQGIDSDVNPALLCRANMTASPRAIAECASHANMPECTATIAPLK